MSGDIKRTNDTEGMMKTTLSAKTYITNICKKVERTFNTTLKNCHSPLECGYHLELDKSEMIDEDKVSKYRILIDSLNRAVTLGRVDIMFAAINLAHHFYVPRQGHLKTAI